MFVLVQRLTELAIARRNTRLLCAEGATEHGAAHYPAIAALHVAWLAAIAVLSIGQTVAAGWLGFYLALQVLRVWTIATLGRRWTTRIIVPRDRGRIVGGPFRFLPHPNYAVVALEIAVVPFALGAPLAALVFTALNAAVLAIRIRCEESAWAGPGG